MRVKTLSQHWKLLSFSLIGKRETNEDRLESFFQWPDERTPICVLIACDGVGIRDGGAECAMAVSQAIRDKLEELLSTHGLSLLKKSHNRLLKESLQQISIDPTRTGATTMVALIFCARRFWNGYHCVVAWAGDSRAHLVDNQGHYQLLTHDHHDEEGHLTAAYVTPEGCCRGGLDVQSFVFAHRPLAVGITTDGVHGKCTEDELRCFLAWSLLQYDLDGKAFGDAAENFLEDNLSDNLSATFMSRRVGLPKAALQNVLEQWRDNHART